MKVNFKHFVNIHWKSIYHNQLWLITMYFLWIPFFHPYACYKCDERFKRFKICKNHLYIRMWPVQWIIWSNDKMLERHKIQSFINKSNEFKWKVESSQSYWVHPHIQLNSYKLNNIRIQWSMIFQSIQISVAFG